MFKRAIVRSPGDNFAKGLTAANLGKPDFLVARRQHDDYCKAFEECGLELVRLPADSKHPDSTFVEDTAILTSRSAILARPGAVSRLGEVDGIRQAVRSFYSSIHEITSPGTLDGGDVCQADSHFFIGISQRTNPEGARQLGQWLVADGFSFSTVDICAVRSILHLKSGMAYLANNDLIVMDELASMEEFSQYNLIRVSKDERYACNCVLVNDRVLVPAGYRHLEDKLSAHGYTPLPLEVSEFRKMDGGLSCLSLRF